jgi:hypothetical protein
MKVQTRNTTRNVMLAPGWYFTPSDCSSPDLVRRARPRHAVASSLGMGCDEGIRGKFPGAPFVGADLRSARGGAATIDGRGNTPLTAASWVDLRACEAFDFGIFRCESNQRLRTRENAKIRIHSQTLRSTPTNRRRSGQSLTGHGVRRRNPELLGAPSRRSGQAALRIDCEFRWAWGPWAIFRIPRGWLPGPALSRYRNVADR